MFLMVSLNEQVAAVQDMQQMFPQVRAAALSEEMTMNVLDSCEDTRLNSERERVALLNAICSHWIVNKLFCTRAMFAQNLILFLLF